MVHSQYAALGWNGMGCTALVTQCISRSHTQRVTSEAHPIPSQRSVCVNAPLGLLTGNVRSFRLARCEVCVQLIAELAAALVTDWRVVAQLLTAVPAQLALVVI